MLSTLAAIIVLLVLTVALVILLTFAAYQASRRRIGYIPLPARAVPAVIDALELKGTGTFMDLGCGDGRVLKAAAAANAKVKAFGVEINPVVVLIARWSLQRMPRASVKRGDINKASLNSARWVFTYLSHGQMAELEPKFDAELSKGSRLVSCDFPLPNRKPIRVIKIGEKWQLGQTLFVYDF